MPFEKGNPWQFQPGNSGGKGKTRGTKDRLSHKLLVELAKDFDEHGKAAIVACRETRPDIYVKIVASFVPKDVNLNLAESPFASLSDAELGALVNAARSFIGARARDEGEGGTPEPSGLH